MRSARRSAQHLRRLELFAECSDAELELVQSLLTPVDGESGRVLFREGSAGREFVIIADGRVGVTRDQLPVAVLGPGAFVGELSLLKRTKRSATVTAMTPVTIYVCNPAEFAGLLSVAPSVARKITDVANSRTAANDIARAA